MDSLLQYHSYVIHQLRQSESTIDVKELLDKIVEFLNNTTNNQNDGFHLLTVICQDLAGVSDRKCFNNADVRQHQFFLILSNTFRMLLTKITFIPLTKQDEQCFDAISLFISHLCLNNNKICTCFFTDNNERLDPENKEIFHLLSYEKIFFTDLFIQKLIRILTNDVAVKDYDPYHIKYKVVDRLLRLFIKLNDIDHQLILDVVIKCVESPIYMKLYKTIDLREAKLNPKQSFFMYQCPKFLRLRGQKRQDEISYSLSKLIMKYSGDIFQKHSPIIFYIKTEDYNVAGKENKQEHYGAKTQAIAWYIEFLNHFALTPLTRVFFLEAIDNNKSILHQMIEILEMKSLIKSVVNNADPFHADVAMMAYAITLLYNLTFEKKIFYELKMKGVEDSCTSLHKAKDKTIQFAALTLSAILNKEDIDEMDSPTQVARSYLYIIENTIDDVTLTYHGIRLDGVLTNLEDIVQNDEVKEEITNDDEGIPLLIRCACEPHLDAEKIQAPALRIIAAISFIDAAVEQIKESDFLMEHIRNLSMRNEVRQEIIVNRILWKVEKEVKRISPPKNPIRNRKKHVFDEKKAIYQYVQGDYRFNLHNEPAEKIDIMISFCQDEKEFAQKLYNRLKESHNRISFDKENKHCSKPEEMAKVVEHSAIIIICFSSKYRNSYECRLEAEYAKKRQQRPIIAVKVERNYHPTGWLNEIIEEKDIIDFADSDYNTAYTQLTNKINEIYEKINQN